jgi:hypothetical protein
MNAATTSLQSPLAAPELCGIGYLFEAAADTSGDHPLRRPFADAAVRFFAAGETKGDSYSYRSAPTGYGERLRQ